MNNIQKTYLSLIIPCYNEEKTLEKIIENVLQLESYQHHYYYHL